jgi:tRNA-dihydrouridine synthase
MSCETESRNATPPTPAIAPGAEAIDAARVARAIGEGTWHWPGAGPNPRACIDPRMLRAVPGFDAPFFQAGLAGYSDGAMRIIARRHGCPLCVTEALLDRTLLAGGRGFDKADLGELHDNVPGGSEDHPLACQIMGSEPSEMAAAALKAMEQRKRSDKAYRMLAYATDGSLSPRAASDTHQTLRLPGGEVVGQFDPSEGCGDDDDFGGCGVEELQGIEQIADDGHAGARPASAAQRGFAVIDVNLACPVKKIEKKARGGHWLTDPRGAIAILEAVREAVPSDVPCTVKLRRSFDDTPEMVENFEVIFDAAYRMGYAWAVVHARTVLQKYVGPSRWTFLKELRARHPEKIILGSGDIWNVHDIFRMIAYAGMSGVSVARGCIGNPWIFRQAREMMAGNVPRPPTLDEQRSVLGEHFRLALACVRRYREPEYAASMMMRKFGIRFAQHHPRSDDVRKRFIAVKSHEEWRKVLEEEYEGEVSR